jgi:dolichol kinase
MYKYAKDFVSEEERYFNFKVGKTLASSLSGFIAGIIVGYIFWLVVSGTSNLYF